MPIIIRLIIFNIASSYNFSVISAITKSTVPIAITPPAMNQSNWIRPWSNTTSGFMALMIALARLRARSVMPIAIIQAAKENKLENILASSLPTPSPHRGRRGQFPGIGTPGSAGALRCTPPPSLAASRCTSWRRHIKKFRRARKYHLPIAPRPVLLPSAHHPFPAR